MKTKTEFDQDKYDRLTSVKFDCVKDQHSYWIFKCDCGNTKSIKAANVRYGKTRSCGCLALKVRQENMRYAQKLKPVPSINENNLNARWASYRSGASKRNLEFSLTKEQFKKLTKLNCKYCNSEPKIEHVRSSKDKYKTRESFNHSKYVYNGIDRIDSTIGYEPENCVPCCRQCNIAKSNQPVSEFYEWIKRVYNNTFHWNHQ